MYSAVEHRIAQTVGNAISDMCDLYEIPKYRLYEILSEFFSIKAKELKPKIRLKPWESQKSFSDYFKDM